MKTKLFFLDFFAFNFGPKKEVPRRIRIKSHSSVTFYQFDPYYRIRDNENADKIKKIAIRYHVEYVAEKGFRVYDKTDPAVEL
jgi:hypothetical protein